MTNIESLLLQIKACKDDAKLLDLVSKTSLALIENNYPYVPKIIHQVTKINSNMNGNGVVHIELKMFEGRVVEGVYHEVTKEKF